MCRKFDFVLVQGANTVPSFIRKKLMIEKSKIIKIVEDFYKDSDKFLVDLNITPANHITIFIDGDNGIKVSDCIDLSKHIETFFNREIEDFELEVSSAGIGKSFLVMRQYYKNIGKDIAVVTNEGAKIKGKLTEVTSEQITLDIKGFLSKKQQKETDNTLTNILFKEIKEAKIILSFN